MRLFIQLVIVMLNGVLLTPAYQFMEKTWIGLRDKRFDGFQTILMDSSPPECAFTCWRMGTCHGMSLQKSTKMCRLHVGEDLEGTLLQMDDWVYFPWTGYQESDYYNYYDQIMTAACAGLNTADGMTFAPRADNGTSCPVMCNNAGQTDTDIAAYANIQCVGWLSIDINATRLSETYMQDTYLLGLGTYKSTDCGQTTHVQGAQSYCCCLAY